jgi:Type ISP C-terminal specificity domain
LAQAVSAFGASVKAKLANAAVDGQPEDQLRAPLEALLKAMEELCGLPKDALQLVGETSLAHIHIRPDYAVTVNSALVGFVEVKAPGKGSDPRKFADTHDKAYGHAVSPEDVMAYIAAAMAHPAFTARFAKDLIRPGLRFPHRRCSAFCASPGAGPRVGAAPLLWRAFRGCGRGQAKEPAAHGQGDAAFHSRRWRHSARARTLAGRHAP